MSDRASMGTAALAALAIIPIAWGMEMPSAALFAALLAGWAGYYWFRSTSGENK